MKPRALLIGAIGLALIVVALSNCAHQPEIEEEDQADAECREQAEAYRYVDAAYRGTFIESALVGMRQLSAYDQCVEAGGS